MYGESDPLNQNCDSEVKIIIGKLLEKKQGRQRGNFNF